MRMLPKPSRKPTLTGTVPPAWAVVTSQCFITPAPPLPMVAGQEPLYDRVVGQLWPAAMVEARRVQDSGGGFQLFLRNARATFQANS